MNNQRDLTINELIKLLGVKSETRIRNSMQSVLKDEDTTKLLKNILHHHLNTLDGVKKHTEILSQQMNLPTKNDIANIAKLLIQIEEKIDNLEEKILRLLPHHAVKVHPRNAKPLHGRQHSKGIDKQKETDKLKELLKTSLIMNTGNFPDVERIFEKLEALDRRVKRRV